MSDQEQEVKAGEGLPERPVLFGRSSMRVLREVNSYADICEHEITTTKRLLAAKDAEIAGLRAKAEEALSELGFQLRSRATAIARQRNSGHTHEYIQKLNSEIDRQQKRAEKVEGEIAGLREQLEEVQRRVLELRELTCIVRMDAYCELSPEQAVSKLYDLWQSALRPVASSTQAVVGELPEQG